MRTFFRSEASIREPRLLAKSNGYGPESMQQSRDGMRRPEKTIDSVNGMQVPNAVNARMNTTGESLGKSMKTRDEMLAELSKQHSFLYERIQTMRTLFRRNAQHQRNTARGAMAIAPWYGGGNGPLGLEKRLETQGASQRMFAQFDTIQALEIELDKVRNQMSILGAQQRAGIPDPAEEANRKSAERMAGAQTGGRDFRGENLLASDPSGRPDRVPLQPGYAQIAPTLPPEVQKALASIPEELRDVTARLYASADPEHQIAVKTFADKVAEQDEKTLRKFFELGFDPTGKAVKPDTIKVDPTDADGIKAIEFMKSLSPVELSVASDLLAQSKTGPEGPRNFTEMPEAFQKRVLKYAKRWNEAKPDSADREIAEGMLYLDGVDVEGSVQGKTLEPGNIKMLGRDQRFFGLIAGLIKVCHGLKRKLGSPQTAEEKKNALKKPEEMGKEERTTEIGENTKKIDELHKRKKALPDEIKKAQEELKTADPEKPDEKAILEKKIAGLQKELEEIPKKIGELEVRNKALEDENKKGDVAKDTPAETRIELRDPKESEQGTSQFFKQPLDKKLEILKGMPEYTGEAPDVVKNYMKAVNAIVTKTREVVKDVKLDDLASLKKAQSEIAAVMRENSGAALLKTQAEVLVRRSDTPQALKDTFYSLVARNMYVAWTRIGIDERIKELEGKASGK